MSEERKLFPKEYNSVPIPRPNPRRPLQAISNFVIEQLPQRNQFLLERDLEAVNSPELTIELTESMLKEPPTKEAVRFRHEINDLVRDNLSPDQAREALADPQLGELALVDLLYLQGSLARYRAMAKHLLGGHLLRDRIKAAATSQGRVATISYGDIILTNPVSGDPRLFTWGDMGKTELDFDETHVRIEARMGRMIDASVGAISLLQGNSPSRVDQAVALLEDPERLREREEVLEGTRVVRGEMTEPYFRTIRGYFNPYPINRPNKGASGALTSKFPTYELLLAGNTMPQNRFKYIEDCLPYFPSQDRESLAYALSVVENGQTLEQLCRELGDPASLLDSLKNMQAFLRKFRVIHMGAVGAQIPESLTKRQRKGTADDKVKQFLKERLDHKFIVRP